MRRDELSAKTIAEPQPVDVPTEIANDPNPHDCWLCDTSLATEDIALCSPCKAALQRRIL